MNIFEIGPDNIRTHSGVLIDVFNPNPDLILIEDIAHSLAHQCRYNGHMNCFYSVAQHSIMVCETVPEKHKLAALLHDASEAYLSDIPSPIKKRLKGYKDLEDNLMKVIANKFGFEYPLHEEVKKADLVQLKYEWDRYVIRNKEYFHNHQVDYELFMYNFRKYI